MKVRVFGLALAPWRFLVVSAANFTFALSAGGAWFPSATANSTLPGLLLSAQVVSIGLLLGAASFFYVGVRNWRPRWTNAAVLFNAAILGGYVGNQLGGL
ncbi:hypothetical protein NG726_17715 [Pseudomonas sp. MOB-449]|nr:hypothetical protein [Pseudomonas sp. MOB-449]